MTPVPNLVYPLNEFYDEARVALPPASGIEDHEIPEPCRSILAHNRDMTPTLEETYGRGVELQVLKYWLRENVFSRQIVLTLQEDGTAVAFGVASINVCFEYLRSGTRYFRRPRRSPFQHD